MTPEAKDNTPDGGSMLTDHGPPGVRVTIEVAGLRETWEYPFIDSALRSALAAVEAIRMELAERHEMAQRLEREFGDGETLPGME